MVEISRAPNTTPRMLVDDFTDDIDSSDQVSQLRTAPQSFDQSFDTKDNKALLVSAQWPTFDSLHIFWPQRSLETKKPVRVIRGYKLDSKYAPQEGYRYDGLYTVVKVRPVCLLPTCASY